MAPRPELIWTGYFSTGLGRYDGDSVAKYRLASGEKLERAMLDSGGEGEASILAAGPGGGLWFAFENGVFGRGGAGIDFEFRVPE